MDKEAVPTLTKAEELTICIRKNQDKREKNIFKGETGMMNKQVFQVHSEKNKS